MTNLLMKCLCLVAIALFASSCEKAESRPLTIYTALETEQVEPYLSAFKRAHPTVPIRLIRDSTGIIIARLVAEAANPQADVVWGTQCTGLLDLETRGMLVPYRPTGIERIRPEFRSTSDSPIWVGVTFVETVIAVNRVEAEKLGLPPIRHFADLLKPEFHGRVVMSHPGSSGIALMTVGGLIQSMGDTAAWEYFAKLNSQLKFCTHSGSKPAKVAASGEAPVGISFGYAAKQQLKRGAPLEIIYPAEGVPFDCEANALIKRPDIHPAAKAFLNWAISDEAMNLYQSVGNNITLISEKSDTSAPKLTAHDLLQTVRNRDAIIKRWNREFTAPKE